MEKPEIKARIASMLDMPISMIRLTQDKEDNPHIEMSPGGELHITYKNSADLIHEFFHACFTSPEAGDGSHLYNALEDFRIDTLARQYDLDLANEVTDMMTRIIERIASQCKSKDISALKATSIPTVVDMTPFTKNLDTDLVSKIKEAKQMILDNQTSYGIYEAYHLLRPLIKEPPKEENEDDPSKIKKIHEESAQEEADERAINSTREALHEKEQLQHSFKKNTTRVPLSLPSKQQQHLITKAMRRIIRNKSIGKRQNTIQGRLNSKRLGRLPSNYLFTKKQSPQPDTVVYILIDLSGSMNGTKMKTTSLFINTLRTMNEKHLDFQLRGFNNLYFTNNQIGNTPREIKKLNCEIINPSTEEVAWNDNDDAHFLNEIMKEMEADPRVNKSLLILSDGQPAPSGIYDLRDLKEMAKKLNKSKLKYASIGIQDKAVKDYYETKKCVIVKDIEELATACSKEIVKLIT